MEISRINTFFSALKATVDITKRFQKVNSLEYAFEFNPLIHFYDIGENKLSEMLAFFLNPNQKHGQGQIFAEIFLKEFELSEIVGTFQNLKIKREQIIDNDRRIDLLLNFDDGRYIIAIENKIWAKDQHQQLKDYCAWLDNNYHDRFNLIYLTPYGHPPSEHSISINDRKQLEEKGTLLLRDHSSDIINLIKAWSEKSKADKVRQFLKDFQQLIQHKVNGNIFMNQQKIIADFILEKPEYIEISFGIYESMEAIKISLFKKLIKQTEEIANELHLTTNPDPKIWDNKGGINFFHRDLTKDHLRIKFIFGDNLIWNLGYGIVCKEANGLPETSEEVQFIKQHQGEFNKLLSFKMPSDNFWYAYDCRTEIRYGATQGYIKIQNGEMKEIIKEKIIKLLNAFKQIDPQRYQFNLV